MEQALRAHRDEALKLLEENRFQTREGIELLVKERLTKLTAKASPGRALEDEQLQAFYIELLDLSFRMFILGYSVAQSDRTGK